MTSTGPLVLGVDSSTTACKVVAFDAEGTAVAEGRAALALENPSPGAWEQDAEAWWSAFAAAARACVNGVDPSRLVGLAIAHQRETFVVTDVEGAPRAPALTWMDHRCAEDVARAVAEVGSDRLHAITGKPPCTTPSLYKLLGQLRREPRIRERMGLVLDVHAFLARRLVERVVTSLASADPMGLVDMVACRWASDLVELAGLRPESLPPLAAVGERLGQVGQRAAQATGLPLGLPVFSGAGDGQAAGLGAGIVAPGIAYLNLGTAVVSGVLSRDYRFDRAFRTLYGASPGSYFLETDLQGGTFTVTWLCERLLGKSLAILDDLDADARALAPGSDGLLLVPYWNGVMNPYWDAGASGIVVGLHGGHGPAHLYRAVLEGIAFEQRLHTRGVEAVAGPVEEVVVMGGGSSSDLWCGILADVLERPVVRSANREATALGAAMIAAVGAEVHPSFEAAAAAMSRRGRRFEPGPDGATYARMFEGRYRHVYPALRALVASSPAG